jgi:hypothetical protein
MAGKGMPVDLGVLWMSKFILGNGRRELTMDENQSVEGLINDETFADSSRRVTM